MKASLAQRSSQLAARAMAPVHTQIARLPDPSGLPLGRLIVIALGVSIALHALLFVLLIIIMLAMPEPPRLTRVPPRQQPAPEPDQLNIQLVAKPKPDVQDGVRVISRRGMQASKDEPDRADFESDENMKAGSESAPTGLLPLPSQEGRTDREAPAFADQEHVTGSPAALPWPQLTLQPRPEPPAEPAPAAAAPASEPLYTPNPVAKETLAAASAAAPTDKIPEPSKQMSTPPPRVAAGTPKPRPTVVKPRDDEIAVATVTPRPTTPQAEPRESVPNKYAMLATPPPSTQSFTKRYQEMLEKTRIEGSISRRGPAGVNAKSGPLGRYQGDMSKQVSSRWSYELKDNPEMLSLSNVKLRWYVQADGRISNVQVIDDGGDRYHADACVKAVLKTKLPPLPPEVSSRLKDGRLEVVFSFLLL